MSIRGWAPGKIVTSPRGSWTATSEKRMGSPSRASYFFNSRVSPGVCGSRSGRSSVATATGKVTSLYNWIAPNGNNYVLYQDGLAVKSFLQGGPTSTLFNAAAATRACSITDLDIWAYIAGYDTSSNGQFQVRVYDDTNVDIAFRAPITLTAASAVDGGAGLCTQGLHYVGFVYTNRNGFTTNATTGITYPITATLSVSFAVTATTNASPDVLTLPGHTFTNGDLVTGAGATGDTAINGVFLVAGVSGDTLQLTDLQGNQINGNGAYVSGGTLTSPDLITAPGNNAQVGDQVTISNATGDTAINGVGLIASIPTPGSTFTLTDLSGNIINSNGAYAGNGLISVPIGVTLNAGNRQISVSVTLPALSDGGTSSNGNVQATLALIFTPQANPAAWFFVPAASPGSTSIVEQNVPYNTPITLSFVADISDEALNASADPANGPNASPNYFLLLTQDESGNGPFSPSFVVPYGTRMCYGDGTNLRVSDQSAPQQLTGDQNVVVMPNQRKIGFAFPLPASNSLYITGQNYTAYVTDNSDVPATWSEPVFVSGTLGSPFPGNVCFRTGGNYVWMATERGLDLFNGQFQQKPVTYLVSGYSGYDANNNAIPIGWNRVNWNAAYCVQVADDVLNQKCYVAVPLDGATEPNFMFVIDYQNSPDGGIAFDNVDIALDQYNPQIFAGIAVVQEVATSKTNLWMGPTAGGAILHFDPNVLCEVESYWESGLVRAAGEINSSMIRIGMLDIWARGSNNATANITVYGPDRVLSVSPPLQSTMGVAATLSPKPGIMYLAKFDLAHVENYTVRFGTPAGMAYELSAFRGYMRADLYNR